MPQPGGATVRTNRLMEPVVNMSDEDGPRRAPFSGAVSNVATGSATIRQWIERAAELHPDKPFIISIDDRKQISYAQFRRLTRQIAAYLHDRGIRPNDRVALLANSSIEHLVCYFGVLAYGATICTIHVEMNRRYLEKVVRLLNPRLVLHENAPELDDLVVQIAAPRFALGEWDCTEGDTFFAATRRLAASTWISLAGERDDAEILFTSGTSAWPKGVVQTYREMLSNVIASAEGFGVTADDRIYDFRSFNWASAQLLGALVPLCRGATLVMTKKFSSSRFFQHLRDYRVTIAAGNPTTINMLLNSNSAVDARDLPALRFVVSSSAPLLLEEWRRFEERFGLCIAQGYGSSETGWIATCPGESRKFGTVGKPLPYHDLAIVGADGRCLPQGKIGFVELGGFADNTFRYLAEDGSVKVNSRGRTQTGDLGYLDADGYLHLTGREKELIIRGGVNISPVEIDEILMQQSEIAEVATVGVPDRVWGEEVVSYVVLRPGSAIGTEDILAFCHCHIPAFKAPKRIIIRNDLPKTDRGKLDRKALVSEWINTDAACATG
jgi:acyl-CoA synthetase (AMP-forming)/AMP-acid ligase II